MYQRYLQADSVRGKIAIQKRYIEVFYFDLYAELFAHNQRNQQPENILKAQCSRIAALFFSLTDDTEKQVTERIYAIVKSGKRYRQLQTEFGDGILVVLSPDLDKQMSALPAMVSSVQY